MPTDLSNDLSIIHYHIPVSIATSKASLPGMDAYERVSLMKQELMDMLEELSSVLPPNTLDELIEELGGPDNVAEVSTNLNSHRDQQIMRSHHVLCHLQ